MKTDIWNEGCPCGDYETDNIKAYSSCRKSNAARDVSGDLVKYVVKNKRGSKKDLKELREIIGKDRDITFMEVPSLGE